MNLFHATISMSNKPFLIIINGESNSGGYALNSEANLSELGLRSSVDILNPVSLVFESLNIGVNNLLDHAGLSNGSTHGFELELANKADTNLLYSGVKLIKTGQGGSTIAQWATNGSYYSKFQQRIAAAKTFINFSDYNIVILFSLGINDAIAGTNINTWKTAVQEHFSAMRNTIGNNNVPIIMTEFQGMGSGGTQYNTYNTGIQELTQVLINVHSVNTSTAGLRDANHWNYTGMKYVTDLMLDKFETLI